MKQFLERLQIIQDECIGRIKGQKKISLLTNVSGAKIRSIEGGLSFAEWKHLADNIQNHSKDWRRFKEDPDKIVIEKNFLLNSLKLTGDFFVFRPVNDCGDTYIQVLTNFYSMMPKNKRIHGSLYLLVVILFSILGFKISAYFFYGFSLLPIMLWCNNKLKKTNIKKKSEWEKMHSEHSHLLFSFAPCSFREKRCYWTRKYARIKIDLSSCLFEEEYRDMIEELAVSAQQMKGKIVWLFKYRGLKLNPDIFTFAYEKNAGEVNDEININIAIKGSGILPGIETENSFIFFLDHFSEEMEKAHRTHDHVFDMLTSKTKNEGGNVKKDDLFKENYVD